MLELRKDINIPSQYYRAGTTTSREEWMKLFPHMRHDESGWFIDLDLVEPDPEPDMIARIVNDVFKSRGLRSISYKEAAAECIHEYIKLNK